MLKILLCEAESDGHAGKSGGVAEGVGNKRVGHVALEEGLCAKALAKGIVGGDIDIDLVLAHVNSYRRASLSGKSPLELFSFLYGEQTLSLFPYKRIDPKDIILLPSLLK